MAALDDEWRKKTQHLLLGAVENDSRFEGLPDHILTGNAKLGGQHQALAADLLDHFEFAAERFELGAEIGADFADVFEKSGALEDLENLQGQAALERPAPKGRAVHAGRESLRHFFAGKNGRQGQACRQGLGHHHNVGLKSELGECEETPGAPQAALDLIANQQGAVGPAKLFRRLEEFLAEFHYPAFALDHFQQHRRPRAA